MHNRVALVSVRGTDYFVLFLTFIFVQVVSPR